MNKRNNNGEVVIGDMGYDGRVILYIIKGIEAVTPTVRVNAKKRQT
jgi:hypothetical protein